MVPDCTKRLDMSTKELQDLVVRTSGSPCVFECECVGGECVCVCVCVMCMNTYVHKITISGFVLPSLCSNLILQF